MIKLTYLKKEAACIWAYCLFGVYIYYAKSLLLLIVFYAIMVGIVAREIVKEQGK